MYFYKNYKTKTIKNNKKSYQYTIYIFAIMVEWKQYDNYMIRNNYVLKRVSEQERYRFHLKL